MTTYVDNGIKILVDHAEDCFLKDDPAAFVLHDGFEWGRKRNGHKGGGTAFNRFRCNDLKCPAVLLVNIAWLAELLGEYQAEAV